MRHDEKNLSNFVRITCQPVLEQAK
ncbi:hypothetical protein AG1IA_01903 [Rhizoctonia solani AG-1 IA]|uniref:Uncharacterized protein n=1 Tax=Thanatephorus cucumeris (strain AG1-IA) TaxID=983506 RepID=L8X4N1_THACA|nr:hypothetical protein AG1IA_01903 [Rhizoctonia solani AG-1 IA]